MELRIRSDRLEVLRRYMNDAALRHVTKRNVTKIVSRKTVNETEGIDGAFLMERLRQVLSSLCVMYVRHA
jgi:hypothetical protein